MVRNIAAHSNYGSGYSVWQTPFPYIIGGVGAVIAFVGFSLFILACSHWKLKSTGYSQETTSSSNDDEKVVVIMAGDDTPSAIALAKPISVSAI